MDTSLVLQNLCSHRRFCFFALGVCGAGGLGSEIPAPLPQGSFPLPAAGIGFRVRGCSSGLASRCGDVFGGRWVMSCWCRSTAFLWLQEGLDRFNAAAIAATYGSIMPSLHHGGRLLDVTAPPTTAFMGGRPRPMESPAIIVGLLLVKTLRRGRAAIQGRGLGRQAVREGDPLAQPAA